MRDVVNTPREMDDGIAFDRGRTEKETRDLRGASLHIISRVGELHTDRSSNFRCMTAITDCYHATDFFSAS